MTGPNRDPALEALWNRVLETWEDEKTHAAVLEYASRTQTLPELAARYRALADHTERGPIARRRLDAIVAAATSMLFSMKTPPRARIPLPITLSAFGICALMLAWLAWAVWGQGSR